MGRMYTLAMRVGRLVEIRVVGALTVEEARALMGGMIQLLPRLAAGARVLSCSDLRAARSVSTAVAEHMAVLLKGSNARLERDATLIGDDKVLAMQTARLIDEAGFDGRRAFPAEEDALAWLAPCANGAELARLKQFLIEGRPKTA